MKILSKNRIGKNSQLIVQDIILYILIFLFTFTAISKSLTYIDFTGQIQQSLNLLNFKKLDARLLSIPYLLASFLAVIFLAVPTTRKIGLSFTFVLLIVSILYIVTMKYVSDYLPCRCLGIIPGLSWDGHLMFNIALITLVSFSLFILKTNQKIIQ